VIIDERAEIFLELRGGGKLRKDGEAFDWRDGNPVMYSELPEEEQGAVLRAVVLWARAPFVIKGGFEHSDPELLVIQTRLRELAHRFSWSSGTW
jgi:hypothetical protein